jgi:hypothetical protein
MTTPPTKMLGAACDPTMNTPYACDCISSPTTGMGYCSKFCTVGGTQCPAGWTCTSQEPTTLAGANDASVPGFTMQNPGLGGFCAPTCKVGGPACPTNSTCHSDVAGGPVCLP